ncbi:diaminopimelate decarboxylase [Aquibacillus sp. 3ASR75-11]|uniref:Diaminopimelate decarboxylase n=1 Tax=Terrihalobacillus insolitus TaxID=2950438 RepID=A0A9X3WRS0_9BACI|nr:diaminopimelate decarboxylase [Terrihalobacillus insolitus]MDC3413100.1 diaminopimelate decarboxylase [Terrihalobacillus insolitus]MDC3424842.1 diaminopimelate decarboxylase [Terrihalobacillus insolitus]
MNHSYHVNQHGHLEIGGIDSVLLAEKYGTPLFVYDVSVIRDNARAFVQTFKELGVKAEVAYASKAFSSVAMLQVAKQENLSLDVVSQGELYTALKANFPVDKMHLHGNNKSYEELEMAVKHNIGCIVIDNFYEITLLKDILANYNRDMDVLIRVTPGIEAHTHDYILTGNEDSKFGFDLSNGQADQAFRKLMEEDRMHVKGLHCHIGSQIFETDGFLLAVRRLFDTIGNWHKQYGYMPKVMNLGGGFGIRYTSEDKPLPLQAYVKALVEEVTAQVEARGLVFPEIWIEPGRAIVGNAGMTIYSIGSKKEIPGIRKYISVDGGMTDNIRPALYQAKYDAVIANKAEIPRTDTVSVAGKSCESGDMLIWDIDVPPTTHGDLLAVFSTGAYGYSMSNHYNRFPKAAVVFVENGKDQLVIKRESYEDVAKNDLSYE